MKFHLLPWSDHSFHHCFKTRRKKRGNQNEFVKQKMRVRKILSMKLVFIVTIIASTVISSTIARNNRQENRKEMWRRYQQIREKLLFKELSNGKDKQHRLSMSNHKKFHSFYHFYSFNFFNRYFGKIFQRPFGKAGL